MRRNRRDPGDVINKQDVYEVWGDMVEDAADMHEAVIHAILAYLENSGLSEFFHCEIVEAKEDERPFLTLRWDDMVADVDARPFGSHLDVYIILGLKRGLLDTPDPMMRIANLSGWQRRDLQLFQTLLKQAIEYSLTALDDGLLI